MSDPLPLPARRVALLGLGALCACAARVAAEALRGGVAPRGGVALWVADRDGGELVGLGPGLLPARRVALPWPTALTPRRRGGAWAVCAREPRAGASGRLVRLEDDGEGRGVAIEVPLPGQESRVVDLAVVDGADALVVLREPARAPPRSGGATEPRADREDGGGRSELARLVRVAADGRATQLVEAPGLRTACGRGALALVGADDGRLRLVRAVDGRPRVLAEARLAAAVRDVAPGPRAGLWWVLRAARPDGPEPPVSRLLLVGADLRSRWSRDAGVRAERLVPVRGEERVWLADATRPAVERYGPGGALELERRDLPLAAGEAGLAWPGGGVALAAPGAVLRLDRRGRSAPGQGGFRHVAAIAAGDAGR